jgi:hypothetical protein
MNKLVNSNLQAKDCPFCGGVVLAVQKHVIAEDLVRYAVLCTSCSSIGPVHESIAGAVKGWDNRLCHSKGHLQLCAA